MAIEPDELATVTMDPSAIETFTSTRVPLEPFKAARLPRDRGNHIVRGRTTRRISSPVATRYVVGFGLVTVIAADLDQTPFAEWTDRLGLVMQLTGDLLASDDQQTVKVNRATAFDDLAGQTRSTLDQFTIKRKVGFSVLSLILLSLVAAIGPLDYLLINRVLGKPLLGWLTFPLMSIALSAVLVYQSKARDVGFKAAVDSSTKSASATAASQCAVNRLEFIDVDAISGQGRAFSWSVIYSHPANRFDLQVTPSDQLKRNR